MHDDAIVIYNIIIYLAMQNSTRDKQNHFSLLTLDILTRYDWANSRWSRDLKCARIQNTDNIEKQLDGGDVDNENENCADEYSLARSARSLRFTTFAKIEVYASYNRERGLRMGILNQRVIYVKVLRQSTRVLT